MILGAKRNSRFICELRCENSVAKLDDMLAVIRPITLKKNSGFWRVIPVCSLAWGFSPILVILALGVIM